MPDNNQEYIGKIVKKILPASLNGKNHSRNPIPIEWIVIHNTGGLNTASSCYDTFHTNARNVSTQYCVDDKEIWQMLEDNWKGYHAGTPQKGQYGADRGASNSNSIGIEICDGPNCDKPKAVELAIELTRHLIKKYNLSVDNVIRHKDVSGKDCPQWIMNNNKWDYMKQEIKKRNDEQKPIQFDPSLLTPDSTTGSGSGSSGEMPNFDNREDWTNLKDIRGVVLVNMPPYHFNSVKTKEESFSILQYDKNFHYLCDSAVWELEKDKTLIANSMQPNDKVTYINRALYSGKAPMFTLSVGLFTSNGLEDYTVTEKKLIDNLSKILWENGLKTKDLWREFDLNKAPSPFMYLDRTQWKKFLTELDKQVEWRYENFGEPELPEKPPITDPDKDEDFKLNIGKKAVCNRNCTLRKEPNLTGTHIKVLDKKTMVEIINYTAGYYQVKVESDENINGWIVMDSLTIEGTEIPETFFLEKNKGIPQPEIKPTMTHEEYLLWKNLTDPKLIDMFVEECEPYDKGLPEIVNASITNDDRLASLTKVLETHNENTVYYSVTEGSPGGTGHCVKPAAELNALYKPDPFKVDPIYPDLIVPPNYSTADYNIQDQNALPITALEDKSILSEELFESSQISYDFDLLKEMDKKSKGKPVNYLDPYPYDDKITELERHSPKVKIDEVESRLYECNHPGCPIAQPMAKNFAMLIDADMNQSKKIESRLVRLENTLSMVLRNLGRMGSRININCVYYGGQDTFGKYKTIRCLKDDRIHDACSVTVDQCLSCTRYEPIIGQIYEILDDNGMNGSTHLDNMQMSYMDLEQYKALNRTEERSVKQKYAFVNRGTDEVPEPMTKQWEEEDKQKYIDSLKKSITDEKELDEKLKAIKQEDYVFKMNWFEQDLDIQKPDVKPYPTEGIKAKYKKLDIEDPTEEQSPEDNEVVEDGIIENLDDVIDDKLDADYIKDLTDLEKLNNGEWVDTREKADTIEENKYSSENYYFEEFNKDSVTIDGSIAGSVVGAECRQKIVEMAKIIVEEHRNLEAAYNQGKPLGNRTTKFEKPIYMQLNRIDPNKKVKIYDCSSLTSCCYHYAGLKSLVNKTSSMQKDEIQNNGGKLWDATMENAKDLLPGDIIWKPGHIGVYIGDNKVAHASGQKHGTGGSPAEIEKNKFKDIRIDDLDNAIAYSFKNGKFGRPKDLIEADSQAQSLGGNVQMVDGKVTINGKEYPTLAKIEKAVCTPYHANTYMGGGSTYSRTGQKYLDIVTNQVINVPTESAGRSQIKFCASHNLPFGTQVFIPGLKEKGLGDGILMVVDNGGHVFDFDINMNDAQKNKFGGKQNQDVYVLKWGEDKLSSLSYTKAARQYSLGKRKELQNSWNSYKNKGGKLIKFLKFNQEDANANINSPLSPID